ncbi:hypothetical protein V2J09_014537 [Rumex salicifolius]
MCIPTDLPTSKCHNDGPQHHPTKTPLLQHTKPGPDPDPNPNNDNITQKPTQFSLAVMEIKAILSISLPMILTGLLQYSRSLISLIFLGRLGDLPLAGGALAVGFANITGYSVLSGLAVGMEPICAQAFGAGRPNKASLAFQRTVILLVLVSVPISILWANMERILLLCKQDRSMAHQAQIYLLFSLPDLLAQSLLHPLRIYLRSQTITLPLTVSAALCTLLHVPINYLLVTVLSLGVQGVALGSVLTNFNFVFFLLLYLVRSKSDEVRLFSAECLSLKGFNSLLNLALPSCVSVCLEWWWYEIMILLCGLLADPTASVASMGILIQTTSLIYIFPSSLSFGVSTRVGNLLGAGSPERARRSAIAGLVMSFFLGVGALHFAVGVRHGWARMFTIDEEIVALTGLALPIIGLCELGNCPQTTGCGVLRGTARPKAGANINLGCFYGVGMPVAVWLGFFGGWDFVGLWVGLLAAQGTCAVAMVWVIGRTDWEAEAQRAMVLIAGGDKWEAGSDEGIKQNNDMQL